MKFIVLSLVLAAAMTISLADQNDLFYNVFTDATDKNLIFSPISIKSALGLAYLGAEGETASQIQKSLNLSADKETAAQEFSKVLSKSGDDFKLNIVNRVYANEKYELAPKFNELASKYFGASAEKVDFSNGDKAVDDINQWVADNTADKIKNLFMKGSFNSGTSAVLVNAIYFKAKWQIQFDKSYTKHHDFSISKTEKIPVDMMFRTAKFSYAENADLDCKFVELKYRNTDLTMMIFLPNTVDGLAAMEEKIKTNHQSISELSGNTVLVDLALPKFKIGYEIKLNPLLIKHGMSAMFSSEADFSRVFAKKEPVKISEAVHKAFIEVNEAGTEAAAATGLVFSSHSAPLGKVYDFTVDHPFFFIIKDKDNIYFTGHVVKF